MKWKGLKPQQALKLNKAPDQLTNKKIAEPHKAPKFMKVLIELDTTYIKPGLYLSEHV